MQINRINTYCSRLFTLFISLLLFSTNILADVEAKEALQVDYKSNGQALSATFTFDAQPKVVFEGETLSILSESGTQSFIIDEVVCFKFVSIETTDIKQQELLPTSQHVYFTFIGNDLIKVTGNSLTPEVALFTTDGRKVSVYSDFSSNEINIHLEALPRGLYIVKTNHHSFKFIRK